MRRGLALLALGLVLAAGPGFGQSQLPAAAPSALLTLDDQRLFAESRFGKALLAGQEAKKQQLAAENRQIEMGLETEERDLTTKRGILPKAEFQPLAEAFNAKVEGIRKAQDVKSRDLTRSFEEERRRFFETASPVLGQILVERGALAIIDKRAVFLGFENLDITDAAIARVDAVLGDGPPATASPQPAEPQAPEPQTAGPQPASPAPASP